MQRIEVITGEARRRRWTVEEKLRILAEAEDPESTVAEVARRHDLHSNQIYSWRRSYAEGRLGKKIARRACFAAIELVPDFAGQPAPIATHTLADKFADEGAGKVACHQQSLMQIILKNDRRLCVAADFDADALKRLLAVLDSA